MKFIDIETLGLESINYPIICIGVGDFEGNRINCFYGEDEKKLLIDFWDSVGDFEEIIGFNSDSFDIPFLITRSLINGVKVKKLKSTDLRKIVHSFFISYDKYAKGTLGDWAKVLGIEQKTIPGSGMLKLFTDGNWSEILKHNREDIEITKKIYLRCKECEVI